MYGQGVHPFSDTGPIPPYVCKSWDEVGSGTRLNLILTSFNCSVVLMLIMHSSFLLACDPCRRSIQAEFASERNWEQYHTPRNVLLAMVGHTHIIKLTLIYYKMKKSLKTKNGVGINS